MTNDLKEVLVHKTIWAEDEIAQAGQLLELCNAFDGLHLKLDMGMLRMRKGKVANDFVYYADGKLVGWLALDEYGAEEVEFTGMVHPDYRRRGIFSALLAAAKEEAKGRGTTRLVVVCERFSHSGQAFVAAIGAAYDFSEHKMLLRDFKERGSYQERIALQKAGAGDVEALALIAASSFGQSVEGARRNILKNMENPYAQYYLGKLGEEAVGCLNRYESDKEYGIYAFAVLLEYRGRGFGRQMLEQVIKEMRAVSRKDIGLEVETENTNAIGLYRSCGFVEITTYGYYNIDVYLGMSSMRWLELTVRTHPEAVESVSELLSRYTPGGVAIEEAIELIDEGQDYRVLAGEPVQVHAYLPLDGQEEEVRQRVAEGLWHLASLGEHFVGDLQTRVVNEEDWANAWKDYFHVTHIGKRLVIRPSWREYTPKDDEVVLELDPGMAFGTGLHPTTRMCLEQVEKHTKSGMRVLDVGTGSGILALAAAKLGAASVVCIDNSSVAVESATANAAVNKLSNKIAVVLGILDEAEAARMAGQYDMVLVNIIAHIIGGMAPQLTQALTSGGLLIASGIIEARRADAEPALLAAGLELIDRAMIDDWIVLIMRKPE